MSDTPTPRTDVHAKSIDQSNFEDSWKDDFEEYAWVTANFARTLERELTAAREELAIHKQALMAIEGGLTFRDYEEVQAGIRRLTRELDVALNGEIDAAKQASLCDLIEPTRKMREQRDRLAEALKKLADCDWVITPRDRMDAVRDIARQALQSLNQP